MKDLDLAGIYIQDIKNFMSAAESQNFSSVAREYDITPSAVSKSIARIENATNLILFTRHQGKIRLTPAGKKFRDCLENFTSYFESAAAEAHKVQEGITGKISIGIPNENVLPRLMDYIRELKSKYERLDISAGIYDFSTLRNKLIDGSLDLIFTIYFEHRSFENTDIKWKMLDEMPLCVFIPDSNPLSEKDRITVPDLRSQRFVMHSASMVPGYTKLINELCESYGFTPIIDKYSDNLGSFIMNLVFGEGVLIGDELLKSNFPESVKCFPLEGTKSGSIIAWDSSKEDKIIKELVGIILKSNK